MIPKEKKLKICGREVRKFEKMSFFKHAINYSVYSFM